MVGILNKENTPSLIIKEKNLIIELTKNGACGIKCIGLHMYIYPLCSLQSIDLEKKVQQSVSSALFNKPQSYEYLFFIVLIVRLIVEHGQNIELVPNRMVISLE